MSDLPLPDHIEEFIFSCEKEALVVIVCLSAQWLIRSSGVTKKELLSLLEQTLDDFKE